MTNGTGPVPPNSGAPSGGAQPNQMIPPSPIPMNIGIRPVMYGQEKLVVLEINTPFGTVFPHLTLETATELGKALVGLTASGRTGLVLPPNAQL